MLLLGIDLGAVSIKAALLGTGDDAEPVSRLRGGSDLWDPVSLTLDLPRIGPSSIIVATYRRTRGRPVEAARDLLGGSSRLWAAARSTACASPAPGAALLRASLGLPGGKRVPGPGRRHRGHRPGDPHPLRDRRASRPRSCSSSATRHRGDLGIADYADQRRLRGRDRVVPRPAGRAAAVRDRGRRRDRGGKRRGRPRSPGAARSSPRAT